MAVLGISRKRPTVALGAALVTIGIATALIFTHLTCGSSNGLPTRAFYSVDDGVTYFKDDANLRPPFDRDGRQVLKAEVFQCTGGQPFVGYLGRFVVAQRPTSTAAGVPQPAPAPAYQVKLPFTGDKGWVNISSGRAEVVCDPHCPDGSKEIPHGVFP